MWNWWWKADGQNYQVSRTKGTVSLTSYQSRLFYGKLIFFSLFWLYEWLMPRSWNFVDYRIRWHYLVFRRNFILLVFLIFSFLLENGMRSVFFFCPTCFYLLIYLLLGFCGASDGKESTCNAGDLSLIPRSWIFPGEGNGNPLHYSCLRNSMDRGAWWTLVHGVAKSRTQLSDFTFTFNAVEGLSWWLRW